MKIKLYRQSCLCPVLITVLVCGTGIVEGNSANIYIDLQLPAACHNQYNPETRKCDQSGTQDGFNTLSSAISALHPGDTLYLRGGEYNQVDLTVSGTEENPITLRGYPGEDAVITNGGNDIGLRLINRHDLTISGLVFRNTLGHGRLEDSTRITIQDCLFSTPQATGTTGALKFVRSTYNIIRNCTFSDSNSDALIFQDNSNYNVLAENIFTRAEHSLLSIRCSSYNVIRNNDFANPDQKAIEIYDCEGVSDAPFRLDSTKHNLFENNRVTNTRASDRNYRYNAIQHGGQFTIVRNNVFRNCKGGGVNYQSYSDESLYVYGNRLYNNTFYNNNCYGIIGNSGRASRYYDNRVVNNLLYRNVSCAGENNQVSIDDPEVVILDHNMLATDAPGFTDVNNNDFSLVAGSPALDAGTFITRTKSSGQGTIVPVIDTAVFFDGFGIPDEKGDIIQFEGEKDTNRIVSVDYENNTITLEKGTTWSSGQGIHLQYGGNAPAAGALEEIMTTAISVPTGLRLLLDKQ